MKTTTARCTAVALALVLLVLPTSALAAEWDQAKVTNIAEQLSDSINEVYRSIARNRTGASVGSGQSADYLRLKDRLRVARNEARHLATALGDGKGHDETEHAYKRLMSLVRDAREIGQRMFIEVGTQEKADAANAAVEALMPYYPSSKR
jgi:hypothetical protein